jgi:NitT/TauT family transport system substrate-binding protein
MNRRRFAGITATAGAALFTTSIFVPRSVSADDLPVVRVMVPEGDDATPTLYAVQSGLFKKYGLDVRVSPAPSGAAALASLAGGASDISASSLFPFFSAHQRGLPLTIVAPLAISTPDEPYAALLVKKDSPMKTGKDFEGKTIASPALRDLNWVATMAWIDQNGGNSANVTSIELTGSAIPVALTEGRIAGSTVTTPRYIQALNGGGVRALAHSYDAIAKRFAFSAIVSTTDYAKAHPDVIANFGRALRDASKYTNVHHAETLPIYADFAKIDPKQITGAPRAVSAAYIEGKDIQAMIDIAVRYKILDKPIDPQSLISPATLKPGQ